MLKLFFLLFALSSCSLLGTYKYSKLNADSDSVDEDDNSLLVQTEAIVGDYCANTFVNVYGEEEELFEHSEGTLETTTAIRMEDLSSEAVDFVNDNNNIQDTDSSATRDFKEIDDDAPTKSKKKTIESQKRPLWAHRVPEMNRFLDLPYQVDPIFGNLPILLVQRLLKNCRQLPAEMLNSISSHFDPEKDAVDQLFHLRYVNKECYELVDLLVRYKFRLTRPLWMPSSLEIGERMLRQVHKRHGPWIDGAPSKLYDLFDTEMAVNHQLEYQMVPIRDCLECRPQRYMFDSSSNTTVFSCCLGYPQICLNIATIVLVILAFFNVKLDDPFYQNVLLIVAPFITLFGNCLVRYLCSVCTFDDFELEVKVEEDLVERDERGARDPQDDADDETRVLID